VRVATVPPSTTLALTTDDMWSMATGILAMKRSGGDGCGRGRNGFALSYFGARAQAQLKAPCEKLFLFGLLDDLAH